MTNSGRAKLRPGKRGQDAAAILRNFIGNRKSSGFWFQKLGLKSAFQPAISIESSPRDTKGPRRSTAVCRTSEIGVLLLLFMLGLDYAGASDCTTP
jgi:hypothetical protein